MSTALQIQEESLANPMAPDNVNHHDIREEKELLDGANDNALIEKSNDGNDDDPSDDPTPSAAKPVNNPVDGGADCQATQPSQSGDDGETASDNPEVVIEPKKQAPGATLEIRSGNVVKSLDAGRGELLVSLDQVKDNRLRQLSRIPVLLASLEHDEKELNVLIEKRGMPKPASHAVTPAANICIAYYVLPERDINSLSTRARISEMVGVVARLRNLSLFDEAGFKFLKGNGGVKGVYNNFNEDGSPKAKQAQEQEQEQEQEGTAFDPVAQPQPGASGDKAKSQRHSPDGGRNQASYGCGKEPPKDSKGDAEKVTELRKGTGISDSVSEPADQDAASEVLPTLDSDRLLTRLRNEYAVATKLSDNIRQQLDHVKRRSDPESVAKREQLEAELASARGASIKASLCEGIVERLRTVTIYADGELKTEQMPPSVVCKDVTTHAGFALMLVALNDDGGFSSVANMTPSLDEFAKVIRTHFDVQV